MLFQGQPIIQYTEDQLIHTMFLPQLCIVWCYYTAVPGTGIYNMSTSVHAQGESK